MTREGIKGFIHQSEQPTRQHMGSAVEVRVIDIKEDGTVNASMLPRKHERLMDDADIIYAYIARRGGSMPYTDRTHPEDIKKIFNMSKGSFKRALGRLMKEKKIYQETGWTYLNKK